MKKNKKHKEFLEHLRKIPIILVACEKSGLSRTSIYRWRDRDEVFAKEMDEALKEGEDLINDLSESQLLTLIKEKNWPAISFWLKTRNPKFKERVEITHKDGNKELTDEQKSLIERALSLTTKLEKINPKDNEHSR